MMRNFSLSVVLLLPVCGVAQQTLSAPTQHSTHAPSHAALSSDEAWNSLLAGNRRFVAGRPRERALVSLRHELTSGQSPKAIILSCSDSRASPELIFDQSLGDIFVVRTAGNVADTVDLGSIEYAIDHLHSPLLVVLGHQKCGAVSAACSRERMPSHSLDAIMEKIDPAVTQAKTYATANNLIESAIRENVHQSAEDILMNSDILRNAVKTGKLQLIEAEYELDTGKVVRLDALSKEHNK